MSIFVPDTDTFSTIRLRAGLSLSEIAQITGKTIRTVYRWENGETRPDKLVIEKLSKYATTYSGSRKGARFTFIDLFAGIGGTRTGFEEFGKCIFSCEWNRFATETYAANFEVDHPVAGDITNLSANDIPEHDLLLAGFPCQPFSIAGVSKKVALGRPHGFLDETQGTLFFDIARILNEHRPAAFLLENVKNLKNHDQGRTFRVIYDTLSNELGYTVGSRIINAKGYLPQNRERIYIVGFREDVGFDLDRLEVPDAENGPVLGSILHPEDGTEEPESPYTYGPDAVVSDRYVLSDKLWNYLQKYAAKHQAKGNGFGFGLAGPEDVARTLSARYFKDGSEILIRRRSGNPRRLTPRECARLMGFDRGGEATFNIPVSDTQAYKQFGNSVAVPVVRAIAKAMLPGITSLASKYSTGQVELSFSIPV